MNNELTRREREVIALVAEGRTNAEIAERLAIEPGTVANHLAHMLRRLGLRNRVQLAVWAVRHEPAASSDPPNAADDDAPQAAVAAPAPDPDDAALPESLRPAEWAQTVHWQRVRSARTAAHAEALLARVKVRYRDGEGEAPRIAAEREGAGG